MWAQEMKALEKTTIPDSAPHRFLDRAVASSARFVLRRSMSSSGVTWTTRFSATGLSLTTSASMMSPILFDFLVDASDDGDQEKDDGYADPQGVLER